MTGFNTTTLNACMDKCVAYNEPNPTKRCVAIVFQTNLTEAEQPGRTYISSVFFRQELDESRSVLKAPGARSVLDFLHY